MQNTAIAVQGLRKVYRLYDQPVDRLKQMVWPGGRARYREFVALDDVSFELRRGEVLGLLGRNGAGKSTLLQAICGTLTPSAGTVAVQGRVAALLELGAGFNLEFTGRENIHMNAAVLGLSRAQIDARYDAIVDFSGIGDFIDQPVKTYSSGMYVRLAFAIATSVDPDILVIDEALSVGDGAFSRKSFDRIMQLKEGGATILFCSHSTYQVEALCSRALWVEKGRIRMDGASAAVVAAYSQSLMSDAPAVVPSAVREGSAVATQMTEATQGHARLLKVHATNGEQAGARLGMESGESDLVIDVAFSADPALPAPTLGFEIQTDLGQTVASGASLIDGVMLVRDEAGVGHVRLELPRLPLLRGRYFVSIYLGCERMLHLYDHALACVELDVRQRGLERGLVQLPHAWRSAAGSGQG